MADFCSQANIQAALADLRGPNGSSEALSNMLNSLCSHVSDLEANRRKLQSTDDALAALLTGVNTGYLLMSSFLVFTMQIGFAMLCAGAVRSKNTRNILITNVLDAAVGAIAWWLIGYGIAYGFTGYNTPGGFKPFHKTAGGVKPTHAAARYIGHSFFAVHELERDTVTNFYLGSNGYAHWLYQWTFSAAAAGIVSGSVAERGSFTAYLGYTALLTGFVYPMIVHWFWSSDGWGSAFSYAAAGGAAAADKSHYATISKGVIDFAGSGVVHLTGGIAGLVGAFFIGPRIGRFDSEGKVNDMPGHSATLYVLGTFMLWFGWYGFNPGSQITIAGGSAVITARTALVTTIGAGAGGMSALFYYFAVKRQWNLLDVCNGVLCGLVSVTSGCSTLQPWAAFISGMIATPIFHGFSVLLLKLKIDDPLDAFPMHAGAGMWGCILTGLLADPKLVAQVYGIPDYGGALYNPSKPNLKWRGRLLGAQLILIITIIAWTGGIMSIYFGILKALKLHRVTEQEEQIGLDISKHGGSAYQVDVQHTKTHDEMK